MLLNFRLLLVVELNQQYPKHKQREINYTVCLILMSMMTTEIYSLDVMTSVTIDLSMGIMLLSIMQINKHVLR